MNSVEQAVKVLQEAEGRLRSLMNEEIAGRRYAELPVLASVTDGLAVLLRNLDAPPANEVAAQLRPMALRSAFPKTNSKREASVQTGGTKGAKKASKYPYFEIDGEWIGKVGWSKKNREEYRHYAPVSAAKALAEHIDRTQKPGRVWTVEDLGDVVDPEAGAAMPSYQLYLVIAWMRSADLLVKQGRSGYIAAGSGTLSPGVKKVLNAA